MENVKLRKIKDILLFSDIKSGNWEMCVTPKSEKQQLSWFIVSKDAPYP